MPEWAAQVFVRLFSTFNDPMSFYSTLQRLLDYKLPLNDSQSLEDSVGYVCTLPPALASQCIHTICQQFMVDDAINDEPALNNGEEADGGIGDDDMPGADHAFGDQARCKFTF
jgi:hypothetical protein